MKVKVALDERSYDVLIDEAGTLPQTLKSFFPDKCRFVILTNETIASADVCGSRIDKWCEELSAEKCVIPDGEKFKTICTWEPVLDFLLRRRCDRKTVLVAVGGGVIGDIGGFAAASFLRGIDFVQVPTTLLSMVDSSVGGKTGVNHPMGKNMIGAFYQPKLVWIDTAVLKTLPPREFLAGYAEVFKYAFIGGREMFDFIRQNHYLIVNGDSSSICEAIIRSVSIKAHVVSIDEKENGPRALLNFGHTFGHALEHHYNFSGILHGEAVNYGMACAIELARRMGRISTNDEGQFREMENLLSNGALPSPLPNADELFDAMLSDKKTIGGSPRFVLPDTCGTSEIVDGADPVMVKNVMRDVWHIS